MFIFVFESDAVYWWSGKQCARQSRYECRAPLYSSKPLPCNCFSLQLHLYLDTASRTGLENLTTASTPTGGINQLAATAWRRLALRPDAKASSRGHTLANGISISAGTVRPRVGGCGFKFPVRTSATALLRSTLQEHKVCLF